MELAMNQETLVALILMIVVLLILAILVVKEQETMLSYKRDVAKD